MASLADLLRYKREIEISDPNTGKPLKKVWIRVLGDMDLNKAYKEARLASAKKRAALRDPETDDYKDEVLGILDLSPEDRIEIIKTSKLSSVMNEATVAVERPDLPKLDEIAVEPDAASLEELETLDTEEQKTDQTYQQRLDEYVNLRMQEIGEHLNTLTPDELIKEAQFEVSNLVPFSVFITELAVQKAFYGTFQDAPCKVREFETLDDFRQLPKSIQEYINAQIGSLEIDGASIKN